VIESLLALFKDARGLAFAICVTGGVVLAGHRFSFWPGDLVSKELLPLFLVMFLLGGGLLLYQFLAVVIGAGKSAKSRTANWWRVKSARRTVFENFRFLTREESIAIIWLLRNRLPAVEGIALHDPFAGLVRRGFLIPLGDFGWQVQKMEINPLLLSENQDAISKLIKDAEASPAGEFFRNQTPPWLRRSGW
jgi:hypothetical protein